MECQSGEYSKVLCWVWWIRGFPGGTSGKEPTCQCRRWKKHGFNPWVGETPRRRRWQLIPVFLPGESQGQRSLAGYSPRGHIELDTTEATKHSTHIMKKGVNIVIYQEVCRHLTSRVHNLPPPSCVYHNFHFSSFYQLSSSTRIVPFIIAVVMDSSLPLTQKISHAFFPSAFHESYS